MIITDRRGYSKTTDSAFLAKLRILIKDHLTVEYCPWFPLALLSITKNSLCFAMLFKAYSLNDTDCYHSLLRHR